jgi:hypothetical protein
MLITFYLTNVKECFRIKERGKMNLEMTIEQGDNGWVLRYCGHDCLGKYIVCKKWDDVLKEMDEYFGWYDSDGHQRKTPH